ncbi:MAG TPA: site-specific DNA-methyltransferase [Planctomycetota bacterium]|nr:site-specific DNA-methyltransferase [Planctomycetota bacterium]
MAQLQFKGKSFVQNHHLVVPYHELIPRPDKSLTDKVSLQDNLILHGDNLLALKALLPMYAGKVKCIYMDPPYNTGNEGWAYNDNVNSPMMLDWLGKVVDRDDLTRHDKWLCMMMPRLKLIRELLRDDGVIMVSIGDDEVHRLRELLDDVFGEDLFICSLIWKRRKNPDSRTKSRVSVDHEYCLVYGRTEGASLRGQPIDLQKYKNPDNDSQGPWASDNLVGLATREQRPNLHYDLEDPQTGLVYECPPTGWRYAKKRMAKLIEDRRIMWPSSPTGRPRYRRYLSDLKDHFTGLSSILKTAFNADATVELTELFEGKEMMDFPKPSQYIRLLVNQVTGPDSGDIVLDSFAGSGTTAHAVLALNDEDGGNRRFLLVECEDYADRLTAERVRRVIQGVPSAKDSRIQEGVGGTFSYFDLGRAITLEGLLSGKHLPSYGELARYVFYTATGEEFDEGKVDEARGFIGESKTYRVYLLYVPDVEKLKNLALTLDWAKALGPHKGKRRLVFAPTKYLDQDHLDKYWIDYAQLPYEIYGLVR